MTTIKGALRRLDVRRIPQQEETVERLRARIQRMEKRMKRLQERNSRLRERNEKLKTSLAHARESLSTRTTAVRETPGLTRLELRRQCVLEGVRQGASILEIGPAHNGILPKRDGYASKSVDYLDRAGLVERYRDFQHYNPEDIEEVDFVLPPGAAMADVIDERFDLVVASHVIEHTTSMIDFLNVCTKLLAPGGVLALVVPDHRYCFDRFRERASISRVIDASLAPPSVHTVGAVVEERLNASRHRGSTAWLPDHWGDYTFVNDIERVKSYAEQARRAETYIDTHNWVCSPNHFRLLLHDLYELDFIALRETYFHDTVRHEFFINLSVDGPGPAESRSGLLTLSENERRSVDLPTFE